MNVIYYDLYCTVIKKNQKESVDDKYENDYINFIAFITPKHYIRRKTIKKY